MYCQVLLICHKLVKVLRIFHYTHLINFKFIVLYLFAQLVV